MFDNRSVFVLSSLSRSLHPVDVSAYRLVPFGLSEKAALCGVFPEDDTKFASVFQDQFVIRLCTEVCVQETCRFVSSMFAYL